MSKMTLAPSNPTCGLKRAGKSCTWTGAEITAQGMPRRLPMWRSICVPRIISGAKGRDRRLDFEIVVGDERLDPNRTRHRADRARHLAVVAAKADDLEAHLLARDSAPSPSRECRRRTRRRACRSGTCCPPRRSTRAGADAARRAARIRRRAPRPRPRSRAWRRRRWARCGCRAGRRFRSIQRAALSAVSG